MSENGLEGVRDVFGKECKQLASTTGNKWKFGGLNFKGLEPFEVDIASVSGAATPLQNISDLILAMDMMQFRECQRRRKWKEILDKEKDEAIRLEIIKRLMDSEDRSLDAALEIVKLLRGTKSVSDKNVKEGVGSDIESQLEGVYISL